MDLIDATFPDGSALGCRIINERERASSVRSSDKLLSQCKDESLPEKIALKMKTSEEDKNVTTNVATVLCSC